MAREERFQSSVRAPGYSPSSSSPGNARLYGLGSSQRKHQQQRSAKPPEPLRRAVADCLSSSGTHLHGSPSALSAEAARTLRDYMAASGTIDMAYSVLLEHTLAEKDRSPAVVSRCVALLKRYLLRYVPKVQTLQQIDVFCASSITECNLISNQEDPSWGGLIHPIGANTTSANIVMPSLPASNYASASMIKSLNFVRSLVARYIPKLSFQPVAFSGASATLRQSLPTLSSLLSRSFNSQLSPEIVNNHETSETKEAASPSALLTPNGEKADGENNRYISVDIPNWRWHGNREQQPSSVKIESTNLPRQQDVRRHGFLEVGAAALLIGDMQAMERDHVCQHFGSINLLDTDQVLQPSAATAVTTFASTCNHLKTITASKRLKLGPHQVWENVPLTTFHPRARPLFQYRYYSEQQPLRLNPSEVGDVIAAVCLEPVPPNSNGMTTLRLHSPGGKAPVDVAVSVLIKLIIDMYVMDPRTAAPLTLVMLEDMLSSSRVASRARVFDIILNLGVHAHLLEPITTEDPSCIEIKASDDMYTSKESGMRRAMESDSQQRISSAIDNFESWLLAILYEILLLIVQAEEKEEIIWASALSCLLYFVCNKGKIWRKRLEGLDIRVIKAFLDISRDHAWAEIVHSKLICMLTYMFYHVSDELANGISETPIFLVEQVDLLGGIDFICLEYARANLREEKQNLFLVLFDYVLHEINKASLVTSGITFTSDEVEPLATLLTLADSPEAFYIAVKHGVEGIGAILRRSISSALPRSSNSERLNLLLDKITGKMDATISSFTRLDNEFLYMFRITKSFKSLHSIEDNLSTADSTNVRLSWTTLHFLLHSDRLAYRHNGYIWLVELLLSGISDGDMSICSNIKNLQRQISLAGSHDLNCLSVPLPVSIFCNLLKSKHNFIRWGFLFVLEKLLMRCKLLLDENKLQLSKENEDSTCKKDDNSLEKAHVIIDLMSCGLLLLFQINETDRINILKMCDILFSQLSLRLLPANGIPCEDTNCFCNLFGFTREGRKVNADIHFSQNPDCHSKVELLEDVSMIKDSDFSIHGSISMAALLLRGHAFAPMQLVTRVPTPALFWPLIQLAGAATDDIALGMAVGSNGRGNLPGASSDIRAALLLLLIGKCTADSAAFVEVGGKEFFRGLLDDTDSRVAYYSSSFLLKRIMIDEPEKYQRLLQSLIFKAQQSNNEKLLENPYLQMRGILQLLSDLGAQL